MSQNGEEFARMKKGKTNKRRRSSRLVRLLCSEALPPLEDACVASPKVTVCQPDSEASAEWMSTVLYSNIANVSSEMDEMIFGRAPGGSATYLALKLPVEYDEKNKLKRIRGLPELQRLRKLHTSSVSEIRKPKKVKLGKKPWASGKAASVKMGKDRNSSIIADAKGSTTKESARPVTPDAMTGAAGEKIPRNCVADTVKPAKLTPTSKSLGNIIAPVQSQKEGLQENDDLFVLDILVPPAELEKHTSAYSVCKNNRSTTLPRPKGRFLLKPRLHRAASISSVIPSPFVPQDLAVGVPLPEWGPNEDFVQTPPPSRNSNQLMPGPPLRVVTAGSHDATHGPPPFPIELPSVDYCCKTPAPSRKSSASQHVSELPSVGMPLLPLMVEETKETQVVDDSSFLQELLDITNVSGKAASGTSPTALKPDSAKGSNDLDDFLDSLFAPCTPRRPSGDDCVGHPAFNGPTPGHCQDV